MLRNGSPFRDYRSVPLTLDLDRDGLKDLILGEWYSSVRLYPNQGTNAAPVFSTFDTLVPADPDSFLNGNPPRVNFADWDGDRDLDMITCDYYGSVFLRRNITPTAVAEPEGPTPVLRRLAITPSPVTRRAVLSLHVNRPCALDVGIFNLSGERVATPFQGMSSAGNLRLSWDACAGFSCSSFRS